jgi:glutathione S-transferase
VQKVLWLCGELELEYELDLHGLEHGRNDQPEYLAHNPMGRVPTIFDGNFVLWESNACLRYLARKHSYGDLYPTDERAMARGNRWMDWGLAHFNQAMRPVFWGLTRATLVDIDQDTMRAKRNEVAVLLAMVDRYLGETDYLAGDGFSIYDIPLGIQAYRWFNLDIEREKLDNFDAWYGRLKARPAFQTHIAVGLT